MVTRRRVVIAVIVLALAASAYTAWLLYTAQKDLRAAEADARALRAAVEGRDTVAADRALQELQESAGSAHGRTDGWWWSALTVVPVVGDDLDGVRALSSSLDELASGAAPALVGLEDQVDGLVADGSVDLAGVREVGRRVAEADDSVSIALDEVAQLDSSGYVETLRAPFEEYVDLVGDVSGTLTSARRATDVAPTMLGADGPRDYLLVFQNNAEIRSTGGLSGAWARLHVEDGSLSLEEQGSAGDFEVEDDPVVPVTEEERAVYDDVIARYFQDPVMVPDFPRAAELFDGFWRTRYPAVELDGVLTVDTVGLSYLLRATDPVTAGPYALTPDNVVQTLLSDVYAQVDDPARQDQLFADAAAAVFSAATTGTTDPATLLEAVEQAVDERRLMLASFDPAVADRLDGTRIVGELATDDDSTPHVDVTVNDATGSKMSYYLDYDAEVSATSCSGGRQELTGTMTLRQTIPQEQAENLSRYVTGDGLFGVEPGTQQMLVRIYAPWEGELGPVFLDGAEMPRFTVAEIDGRQVITLAIAVYGSADVGLEWTMTTGPGQSGAGELGVTPKVTPGRVGGAFTTAC